MRFAVITAFLAGMQPLAAPVQPTRSIFLNGIDISSARGQALKNVDLHINENGDVFIIAPHYQVNEEDTYVPLSKYVQGLNQPEHKAPQALGGNVPEMAGQPALGTAVKGKSDPLAPKPDTPASPAAEKQMIPTGIVAKEPPPASANDLPGAASGGAPMTGASKGDEPPPGLPAEDAAPAGDAPPGSEPPLKAKPLGG